MEEANKLTEEFNKVVNYFINNFSDNFESHEIVQVSTSVLIYVLGKIYLTNKFKESCVSKPESISVLIITHVLGQKSSIEVNDEQFEFENNEESFHNTALKIINKLS
jgi:RsiW-degrading membrane proteinase PrsW (M82 family)